MSDPDGSWSAAARAERPPFAWGRDLPPVTAATAPRLSQLAVAAIAFTASGASVVAIVLAVLARRRIEESDGLLYGEELAGWALGVSCAVLAVEVVLLLTVVG